MLGKDHRKDLPIYRGRHDQLSAGGMGLSERGDSGLSDNANILSRSDLMSIGDLGFVPANRRGKNNTSKPSKNVQGRREKTSSTLGGGNKGSRPNLKDYQVGTSFDTFYQSLLLFWTLIAYIIYIHLKNRSYIQCLFDNAVFGSCKVI